MAEFDPLKAKRHWDKYGFCDTEYFYVCSNVHFPQVSLVFD